jgi:uncharacterized repeat protein (TIGR01451 family)
VTGADSTTAINANAPYIARYEIDPDDAQEDEGVDLATTKTDNQTSYLPGAPITYTIVVTNSGPATAIGFSIADAVPAVITGVSATCVPTGTGNSCGTNASSGNAVSFANATTLNPGTGNNLTVTVTGTVSPSATGDLTNTATVTPAAGVTDANPANNSATDTDTQATTQAQVDLSIVKVGPATATPGGGIQYTLTVSNAGPSDATGFSIADAVPNTIAVSNVSCVVAGAGSCGTNASAGNNVSFTGAALTAGAGNALTITIGGTVSATATGALTNTASVSAGAGAVDVNPNNNSASTAAALTPTQPPPPSTGTTPAPILSWSALLSLIVLLLNLGLVVMARRKARN